MKTVKKTKTVEHPLEDEFGIEKGTTVVEYKEVLPAEPVKMPDYDAKDDEIETKLEEVYAAAMGNAEAVGDAIETVEGKYKARVGEVTAAMLTVALGAVREKRELKKHKDQVMLDNGGEDGNTPRSVTNNLGVVVADRNEILRLIEERAKEKQ